MQVLGSPLGWVSDYFAEHPDAESKDILLTRIIEAGWMSEQAPLTNTKVARKANAGIIFQLLLISTAKKSIAVMHSEDKEQSHGMVPRVLQFFNWYLNGYSSDIEKSWRLSLC